MLDKDESKHVEQFSYSCLRDECFKMPWYRTLTILKRFSYFFRSSFSICAISNILCTYETDKMTPLGKFGIPFLASLISLAHSQCGPKVTGNTTTLCQAVQNYNASGSESKLDEFSILNAIGALKLKYFNFPLVKELWDPLIAYDEPLHPIPVGPSIYFFFCIAILFCYCMTRATRKMFESTRKKMDLHPRTSKLPTLPLYWLQQTKREQAMNREVRNTWAWLAKKFILSPTDPLLEELDESLTYTTWEDFQIPRDTWDLINVVLRLNELYVKLLKDQKTAEKEGLKQALIELNKSMLKGGKMFPLPLAELPDDMVPKDVKEWEEEALDPLENKLMQQELVKVDVPVEEEKEESSSEEEIEKLAGIRKERERIIKVIKQTAKVKRKKKQEKEKAAKKQIAKGKAPSSTGGKGKGTGTKAAGGKKEGGKPKSDQGEKEEEEESEEESDEVDEDEEDEEDEDEEEDEFAFLRGIPRGESSMSISSSLGSSVMTIGMEKERAKSLLPVKKLSPLPPADLTKKPSPPKKKFEEGAMSAKQSPVVTALPTAPLQMAKPPPPIKPKPEVKKSLPGKQPPKSTKEEVKKQLLTASQISPPKSKPKVPEKPKEVTKPEPVKPKPKEQPKPVPKPVEPPKPVPKPQEPPKPVPKPVEPLKPPPPKPKVLEPPKPKPQPVPIKPPPSPPPPQLKPQAQLQAPKSSLPLPSVVISKVPTPRESVQPKPHPIVSKAVSEPPHVSKRLLAHTEVSHAKTQSAKELAAKATLETLKKKHQLHPSHLHPSKAKLKKKKKGIGKLKPQAKSGAAAGPSVSKRVSPSSPYFAALQKQPPPPPSKPPLFVKSAPPTARGPQGSTDFDDDELRRMLISKFPKGRFTQTNPRRHSRSKPEESLEKSHFLMKGKPLLPSSKGDSSMEMEKMREDNKEAEGEEEEGQSSPRPSEESRTSK